MSLPQGLTRWAAIVEYRGAGFQGFQRQISAKYTVQGELERALSKVANEPISLVCAGRTDAGVHATAQVIHFDTRSVRDPRAWVAGVNTQLPEQIRILRAQAMAPAFHARFSATARTYRYLSYVAPVRPAIMAGAVTWVGHSLDPKLMHQAAVDLVGEHDFSSFRSSQCQAHSPVRRILDVQVQRAGHLLVTQIKANAFLHHMVRNIMGALHQIGAGRKPPSWIKDLISQKDRTQAAATASAHGLYLVAVDYPQQFNLFQTSTGPIFLTGA